LPRIGYCSTGGLGNKIPLILAPLVASAGVSTPLISPSSLNTQDNTLNIFASIPGVRTSLSLEEFQAQLQKVGSVIASIPKQAASSHQKVHKFDHPSASGMSLAEIENLVLSQKLAGGIQGIVFDVKVGEGSFLKSRPEARIFISILERVCNRLEIPSSFFLSDLNQPLGESIGNCLEVIEAVKVLKGNGPLDVLKLALELGSEMLSLAKKSKTKIIAKSNLKRKIEDGNALKKFEEIIKAQGGNPLFISAGSLLFQSKLMKRVYSPRKGYLHRVKMREINHLWYELTANEPERDRAGFLIFKKIGDRIEEDEAIAEVYLSEAGSWPVIKRQLRKAFILSKNAPDFKPFIIESIRKN
jgi:thymidine phosphorylase